MKVFELIEILNSMPPTASVVFRWHRKMGAIDVCKATKAMANDVIVVTHDEAFSDSEEVVILSYSD